MVEVRASVELIEPTSISPNTSVSVVLRYTNRNEDVAHRVGPVIVSPTWDPSHESVLDIDREVPGGDAIKVTGHSLEAPVGLGGKHGIFFEYDVEAEREDGSVVTQRRCCASPLRAPVSNTPQYQAVVCSAGGETPPPAVRRGLENWGFQLHVGDTVQDVKAQFTEYEDTPPCFVGVIPADATEEGRQLVSSAVWAGADADLPDADVLSLLLVETGVEPPELPPACCVLPCDLGDERDVLRTLGPELLGVRQGLATGQTAELVTVLREKGEETIKQQPAKLLEALVHSTILNVTGATDAAVELLEQPERLLPSPEETPSSDAGGWPMRGGNLSHTGHRPQQHGPVQSVTQKWHFETGRYVKSSPAVVDGTVYVGSTDDSVYALTEK